MLKMISKSVLLLGLGTALSGCLLTRNQDFNEAALEGASLLARAAVQDPYELDDMPTSGEATYSGVAAINLEDRLDLGDENNDYYADITLSATFEDDGLTGGMSNFQSPDGEVGGELELSDGAIDGAEIDGMFSGMLDDDGTDIELTLFVDGDFVGDGTGNPSFINGTYVGVYETSDEDGPAFGAFVAEID